MKPENLFCVAVKQAKRLTKRLNKNKKSTEDSDSDEDDLVRIFDWSPIWKLPIRIIVVARMPTMII